MMDADQFLVAVHAHTHENIRFADAKALAFLAIDSGVIAALFSKDLLLFQFSSAWTITESVLSIVTFAALVVGIFFSAVVVWPRGIRVEKRTVGGFLTIASKIAGEHKTARDYATCVSVAAERGELTYDLAALLYARSVVSTKKFFWLRVAIVTSGVGLLAASSFVPLHVWRSRSMALVRSPDQRETAPAAASTDRAPCGGQPLY